MPNLINAVVLASLLLPGSSWAVDTVLSGVFDGSEPKIASLPGGCGESLPLGYQVIGSFGVSFSGTYSVSDAFNFNPADITAVIYKGTFFPANPGINLVTPNGVDHVESVVLTSGSSYLLVVQSWCAPREGAWAVTFSGPGSVNSVSSVSVPAFTSGTFSAADPTLDSECGNSQYKQTGPIQVARSGLYYFTDISINHDVDLCLQIYTKPLDVTNPDSNRIVLLDDDGAVQLEAGTNYYFVVQPFFEETDGEFFYVFAPPAPFRLNPAMAGGWYNPSTSGQGFFLDVFDQLNQVFLAWFTFDLSRPDESVIAEIGDPGHRWLTAYGPFSGGSADLAIEWTVGGVFDSSTPQPDQSEDGTISIEFTNCYSGTVTYDLGSSNASGVVAVQRLSDDTVGLCQYALSGPGQPGML